MSGPVSAIILAAGASRRMRGRDKLMEPVAEGVPMLRRVCDAAWASAAAEVVVVLGARAEAREDVLEFGGPRAVFNPDWQSGMASSIRAGIAALDDGIAGTLILLGDMPEIGTPLLDRMIAAFDPAQGIDIVRPRTPSGVAGNPVLFGRRHFAALQALNGDTGAKAIIAAHPSHVLDLPTADESILVDLDTPEAWSAWRAGR